MSYYVATDKFGNFDLRHYGVKGMKWGEVHEDPLMGQQRARIGAIKSTGSNRSIGATSSSGGRMAASPSMASGIRTINTVKTSDKQSSGPIEPGSLEAKIAEAESKYKEAVTSMQMMARISLSQGLSPMTDPDYISARKAVIKAKYELDKLRLDQQAKAAKEPAPTYAEEKKNMDKEAREARKEEGTDDLEYAQRRREVIDRAFDGRDMPEEIRRLRDSNKRGTKNN